MGYPVSKKIITKPDLDREMMNRAALLDFILGLLNLNPLERWSPQQAKLHPFITGQKFTGPFTPPMEFRARTRPVSEAINVTPTASMNTVSHPEQQPYRRTRANTISSAKLASIPPQLQKVAAVNSKIQLPSKYPSQYNRKMSISSIASSLHDGISDTRLGATLSISTSPHDIGREQRITADPTCQRIAHDMNHMSLCKFVIFSFCLLFPQCLRRYQQDLLPGPMTSEMIPSHHSHLSNPIIKQCSNSRLQCESLDLILSRKK
jgi:hypothetical protein